MVRKKKTNKALVWVIAIVLIGALFWFGTQQFGFTGPPGGATIFSIDSVNIMGQGEESTEWVIALAMNDGAESVYGEITPEDIANYNLDSVPASAFSIQFQLRNPSCKYDLVLDSEQIIGPLYYDFVHEECLAQVCPYDIIGTNELIQKCITSGDEDCGRMVSLLDLGGGYTEWCYWLPEESNVAQQGECNEYTEITTTVQRTQQGCRLLDVTETITTTITEGESGGDWQVMSVGVKPEYAVTRISSAEQFAYEAVVIATMEETGEEFECIITPTTSVCELGDFGSVKFAGNLLANQGCPDPGNDIQVLYDIDEQEWISVDSGAGSLLGTYLSNMNLIKDMNVDYYTFVAVPLEQVQTSTDFAGMVCDPAVGNPVFPIVTSMNTIQGNIPNDEPVIDYNCHVEDDSTYVCESGASVVYPLLKLTVKASKVGIFVPQGQPEIFGASTQRAEALSGVFADVFLDPLQLTNLYVAVKNTGSELDSFDVTLECPFPVTQQSQRVAVESGDTSVTTLVISGDGLIQDCTLKANSVGYPSNIDEEEIHIVINPQCDQYGINTGDMVFTEYGCFAMMSFPDTPCTNEEFWLTHLRRCIHKDEIATGEQRLALLEEVAEADCSRQCNGNAECILTCLDNGNIKPVCIGIGQMMTLNDYICDFERQPNLIVPSSQNNAVWVDAPVCNYLCEYGYSLSTSGQCVQIQIDEDFNYLTRPPTASFLSSSVVCESCFDGVMNQDEEGIDCNGICLENYGAGYDCDKLRAPDHCYNHIIDGDEEGRDCGGSCDFDCNEIYPYAGSGAGFEVPGLGKISVPWLIFIGLAIVVMVLLLVARRKKGKRR